MLCKSFIYIYISIYINENKKIKIEDAFKNEKIKPMLDFDKNECNSITSIAVRGNTTIDITTRFIKGKMLMFAKMSLKSFVYDLMNVFCFPMEEVTNMIL